MKRFLQILQYRTSNDWSFSDHEPRKGKVKMFNLRKKQKQEEFNGHHI